MRVCTVGFGGVTTGGVIVGVVGILGGVAGLAVVGTAGVLARAMLGGAVTASAQVSAMSILVFTGGEG
jgi:hypothetical protein